MSGTDSVQWLRAKFRRHGEQEDADAADELERLRTFEMHAIFMEQERDEARRSLVHIRTQVANALTDMDDGDEEAAMDMLRAIAGLDVAPSDEQGPQP